MPTKAFGGSVGKISNALLRKITVAVRELYFEKGGSLPFHGWTHVNFVRYMSKIFAQEVSVDPNLVEAAALLHDLNYIIDASSSPSLAGDFRREILLGLGATEAIVDAIECIIVEAHLAGRDGNISKEGMALSDADTLYKALPITPILFSGKYLLEAKVSIFELAEKIVSEQEPLFVEGVYFYTDSARAKYMKWAVGNLNLWKNVLELRAESEIVELLGFGREEG